MAIGREPEPVEDRWLEQTESKAVSAEARIDGDCTKAMHGALLHQFNRHLQYRLIQYRLSMQRLQRFKGQIVVTVTVTSEVKGARKAGKCEAPTLSDEHTMQRIGGGQGLRVRGAAHTEHVWPGWERRATRSPKKNNPFLL